MTSEATNNNFRYVFSGLAVPFVFFGPFSPSDTTTMSSAAVESSPAPAPEAEPTIRSLKRKRGVNTADLRRQRQTQLAVAASSAARVYVASPFVSWIRIANQDSTATRRKRTLQASYQQGNQIPLRNVISVTILSNTSTKRSWSRFLTHEGLPTANQYQFQEVIDQEDPDYEEEEKAPRHGTPNDDPC
ncbi:hypothetical protein FSARC_8429 [Fusarium sarcochroum]|uniref:Uncharacterized protein n=1 Tax=Fusarium sarcochroum TaxID=1208366 RepID=A0A8H4X774_9HYPO|nr:hypothetical protein FSARC_8429 [Fusarium sarcochroum]